MFDGYITCDAYSVAVFATFTSETSLGFFSIFRAVAPLDDETVQVTDEHICFLN